MHLTNILKLHNTGTIRHIPWESDSPVILQLAFYKDKWVTPAMAEFIRTIKDEAAVWTSVFLHSCQYYQTSIELIFSDPAEALTNPPQTLYELRVGKEVHLGRHYWAKIPAGRYFTMIFPDVWNP